MGDLLIAIGGTGQHTALAVARLAFLGVLPRMTVFTIDSDDQHELSNNLKTFGGTVDGAAASQPDKAYAHHPLDNGDKIYPPFNKGMRTEPKFEDLFINQDTRKTERDLFELVFDETSANVVVKEGMFGRPVVGATIYAQSKSNEEFNDLTSKANDAGNIFITGSMVGGTGAGIMHQLIKSLPADKHKYGIIFLRWFKTPDGAATVTNLTMERNMRYGLDYFFKDTRERLNSALLIGAPEQQLEGLQPLTVAGGQLGEKPHFFHLMAAYGMLKLPQIAVTAGPTHDVYAATYKGNAQMYAEPWGNSQNAHALEWYVNRARYVKEILDYVSSSDYTEQVEKLFGWKSIMGASAGHVGEGLYKALTRYDRKEKESLKEMAATWRALSQQYKFALDWLEEIIGALSPVRYHTAYKALLDNPTNRVTLIQTLWKEPPPKREQAPTPQEVARELHQRLVASFQ